MCGIAGLIDPRLAPTAREAAVERMCTAMLHRGPDDQGIASRGMATLGMRRLAIFDPANGHQPMFTPDGRFTLVFNGAIYNFRAIREQLAGDAWTFRTNCDTEVLLAAYVRWGAACLSRLRGMFAFAVWDGREEELFLARDPFGIKPLYYRQDGPQLLFGSELNALTASGHGDHSLDPAAVVDYLGWLAVPAPRTIYRHTRSLLPGESAVFRRGTLATRPTWSFRSIPAASRPCRSRPEFVRELRQRLEESVQAHVVADVPVGAFLSGGLDSAAVVGLMGRASGARLRTFSIDFCEPGYSEAGAAAATARHLGTDHHTTALTGADVARDIDALLGSMDQPTGDGLNTYYASRAARAGGVTVALSGLGGDELFGGYPSFRDTPRLARWLAGWRLLPRPLQARLVARLRGGDIRRGKLADVLAHARSLSEVGSMQRRVYATRSIAALLDPAALPPDGAPGAFHPALAELAGDLDEGHPLELVSAWELRTYMADVLLRDSDVMSMRHSLELRVPLVDRPLLEWLWHQPAEFKFDARQPKSALREALADLLPPDMARRQKWGFSLPMTVWMKRELRPFLDDTFAEASIRRSGLFIPAAVTQSWQQFLAAGDPRAWSRVWSLAVLIAFANRRGGSPSSASPAAVALQSSAAQPAVSRRPSAALPPTSAPGSGPEASAADSPPASPTGVAETTLLLVPEIFSSEGGISRILRTYLKAICDRTAPGGEVRLLALNDPAISPAATAPYANARLTAAIGCGRRKGKLIWETLRLARGCDRLICGHVFLLPVAWLARRFNPRLRYYLVAHGIEVWRPFRLAERLALRGAERIFCVSEYTRGELMRRCPLPEGRAVVLPNALDPAFPIAPGRPLAECAPVILMVTRLTFADRYKGVEHMIAALPAIRVAEPAARLRIVGRGDDLPRLQALAQSLGVGGAVDFAGYVDDTRLAEEFRACRLFALPSQGEGFGLVFLEAMAHGRPCLGARAGGIPEVVTADTGILVDFGDIVALARETVAALQRDWQPVALLNRARAFSYPVFRHRLDALLHP